MASLGHVVFYVRDLERSISFYTDIVGLEVTGTMFNKRAALLSGGSSHHELMLIQMGEAEGPLQGKRIGLYHVGWKVGDSLATLTSYYNRLMEMDYPVAGLADHTVSKSIYLKDPDGNEVELYVDDSSVDWKNNSSWMQEPVKPLRLNMIKPN